MVNDITLAEDLRQEVFLRIYRSAKIVPSNGDSFPHGCIESRRISVWIHLPNQGNCRKETPIGGYLGSASEGLDERFIDLSDPPDAAVLKKEIEDRVRSAVACLPEDLRVVVTLRHYNGMKFHEIAEIVERPISTVKSRMAAGMERLSKMLSKSRINFVSVDR